MRAADAPALLPGLRRDGRLRVRQLRRRQARVRPVPVQGRRRRLLLQCLVCDDCHDKTTGTRTAAYASALKATRASALKENPLKYVVQEAVTAKTRLCEDCVERLEALGQDE